MHGQRLLTDISPGVSALTDLLFALLPIPLMYGVQMNRRTKIAIASILSLGILCVPTVF